jgi:hypothetical protein
VENTLRHLYFSDHPVEFARMNKEGKFFLTTEELLEYLLRHPDFTDTEPKFDAINRLGSLYSELSAGIHGRKVQHLEMRVSLNKISFSQAALEQHEARVETCAEASNFLLATYHREQMRSFQRDDRKIILGTMRPQARQVWTALT